VLSTLDASCKPLLSYLEVDDWEQRAEAVISAASQLGCAQVITPRDILEAENERVNMAFIAEVLRTCDGLPNPPEEITIERTREVTVEETAKEEVHQQEMEIKKWILSLGIGVSVADFVEDFKDGRALLRILNKVLGGGVDEKKMNSKPSNSFRCIENLEYGIRVMHDVLKLPNMHITGQEIANGVEGKAFTLVSQLFNYSTKKGNATAKPSTRLIRRASSGQQLFRRSRVKATSSKDVVEWLNEKLARFELAQIKQVNEITLLSLHALLKAFEPNIADLSENEPLDNARYLLSVAWKIGAEVPLAAQDLCREDPQSRETFCSHLMVHECLQV